MSKKLYLVETISIFRQRYVVEAREEEHALDEVVLNINGYEDNWKEFSQKHIEEVVTSSREVSKKEYLKLYNEDNDYAKSWSDEKKLSYVNKIEYKD
jgi:hypothetical protein